MGNPLGPSLDKDKTIFRLSEIIFTVKFGPSSGGNVDVMVSRKVHQRNVDLGDLFYIVFILDRVSFFIKSPV